MWDTPGSVPLGRGRFGAPNSRTSCHPDPGGRSEIGQFPGLVMRSGRRSCYVRRRHEVQGPECGGDGRRRGGLPPTLGRSDALAPARPQLATDRHPAGPDHCFRRTAEYVVLCCSGSPARAPLRFTPKGRPCGIAKPPGSALAAGTVADVAAPRAGFPAGYVRGARRASCASSQTCSTLPAPDGSRSLASSIYSAPQMTEPAPPPEGTRARSAQTRNRNRWKAVKWQSHRAVYAHPGHQS